MENKNKNGLLEARIHKYIIHDTRYTTILCVGFSVGLE